MFKTIAIALLTLALGGAGYFAFTQKSAYGHASTEVAELAEKIKEAEQKEEEAAAELKAAEEALPPLEAKVKELEAVKGALASGAVLKDLEALYAKEKKLSTEKQLGLAGIRMLTNGGKDPSTIEAFNKALEMTDWKGQQQVVCAAQKALAASGEKVKVMSECAADAPAEKGDKHAKDSKTEKDDGHGKKDAHGKDAKKDDKHVAHWDYEGEMGPENWGKEFPTCGKGKSQSPLNIKGPFEKVRYTVVPDYKPGPLKILNNGHTIQVNVNPGSKIRIDGKAFDLLQFHFHRPSEEHINGKPSAMVIHFVHKNESGELAVLGVLLQEGNENPGIKTLWSHAPPKEGPEVAPDNVAFNPMNLLPREMEFYHYDGSLTTPPCTEKVKFYILKSQVNISKDQVTQFPFKMNARPVQPLNDRKILTN
ncbi:MAG: carbonic anhydrase family protein [Betaproteobacteria bacterium]|nr:carbonic anhydrase family protein [Betaproteobacteria bacterium]